MICTECVRRLQTVFKPRNDSDDDDGPRQYSKRQYIKGEQVIRWINEHVAANENGAVDQ